MPTECAESGCPNRTDSGICQQCAAEQKYGTTSRAYDADGSRVELRDGETRDDDSHAGVIAAQLAEADDEDLEELEDEREVRTDGGRDLECSNPDWSDNCNGDLETERERKKGLCEGCMAVIRSWSDDDADTDDTAQTRLVTDGGTVEDWHGTEAPASVDGVDLLAADACPACESTDTFFEGPAGYFTCDRCHSTWAGDAGDAEIVTYLEWSESDEQLVTDGGHQIDTDCCNVRGGDETDHHLVLEIERLFGASVWIYDDGFARVVPNVTRSLITDTEAHQ